MIAKGLNGMNPPLYSNTISLHEPPLDNTQIQIEYSYRE